MMIGPEPMTRIRWRSARRGMDQIVDDVIARPAGGPAGGATELAVAADLHRHVHGTDQPRIAANLGRSFKSLQDALREGTHAHAFGAADVVDLAHRALGRQRKISVAQLADVQEITDGVAVADLQ